MTTVHVIQAGYDAERTGASITLVLDGDARIVVDPGLVAHRSRILDPLADLGIDPASVTHVVVTHQHLDHTLNIALFPEAEVIDFASRYRGDEWLDHPGDGWRISPRTELWLTPGHTEEDASLIVEADDGIYAMTHAWWYQDRGPEVDPYAPDLAILEASRARILAAVDIVIPGHGGAFRVER